MVGFKLHRSIVDAYFFYDKLSRMLKAWKDKVSYLRILEGGGDIRKDGAIAKTGAAKNSGRDIDAHYFCTMSVDMVYDISIEALGFSRKAGAKDCVYDDISIAVEKVIYVLAV